MLIDYFFFSMFVLNILLIVCNEWSIVSDLSEERGEGTSFHPLSLMNKGFQRKGEG